jgi:hypothetical protein
MNYDTLMAVLLGKATSLRFAASCDKRPCGLKYGLLALQRTNIYEFECLAGVACQEDLSRDLTAHDNWKIVHNRITVQRMPQARSPARKVCRRAFKFVKIQNARPKMHRKIPQHPATLQLFQNVDQPRRMRWRHI